MAFEYFEKPLTVVYRADRIGNYNKIEWAFQRANEFFVFDITHMKCQMRIITTRLPDHLRTKIYTDTNRGI